MFLRIHYSPQDIEIFAVISDNGDIYWSGADICKILNYSHASQTLKRYLGIENLTKITNILENCYSNNYVLTYDQIIQFFTSIPTHRRVKMFEEWFQDVNDGSKKIYLLNPELLQQYLFHPNDHYWFKNLTTTTSRNHCIRFDDTLEVEEVKNSKYETTLPDILRKRRSEISSNKEIKKMLIKNYVNKENEKKNNNLDDLLKCFPGESMDEERQKTTTSFSKLKEEKWCDKSKTLVYRDEQSGETYEYIAIDLNWKRNEMRPIHIYPTLRFEEGGAFLYVPFRQQTL